MVEELQYNSVSIDQLEYIKDAMLEYDDKLKHMSVFQQELI